MKTRRQFVLPLVTGLVALLVVAGPVLAEQLMGTVEEVNATENEIVVKEKGTDKEQTVKVDARTKITKDGMEIELKDVMKGDRVDVTHEEGTASKIEVKKQQR